VAKLFRKGRDGILYAWGWLPDGTRWTRSTGTTKQRDAARRAAELEAECRAEADRAAVEDASLGAAMSGLYESMRIGGKAPATVRNVESKGGQVLRILGVNRKLSTLEPPQGCEVLSAYVRQRASEEVQKPDDEGKPRYTQRSTIASELAILFMALNRAARHGKFRGPVRALAVPELRGAHKPRKSWRTIEESKRLIAETPAQWRDHVEVYIGTGARRMELYRITAADIDAETNRVHIRGTKTEQADRWVPMTPRVREILTRRAEARPTGRLFNEWTRAHLDLAAICERAKVPYTMVSDLRRTFASLLLSAGVSSSVLKELMGHTTTKQIDLVYGHASEEARQGATMRHPLADSGSRAEAVTRKRVAKKTTPGTGKPPRSR
jgi:integrase